MNKPVLALDIGLKRTGVALSESGLIAQPLGVIEWQLPHAHTLIQEIIQYIRRYDARTLLVGMPLSQEEGPTSQALKTEHLVSQIEDALTAEGLVVEVLRVNEFHSTLDSAELYPNTDKDAAAATLLLQDFLEEQGAAW